MLILIRSYLNFFKVVFTKHLYNVHNFLFLMYKKPKKPQKKNLKRHGPPTDQPIRIKLPRDNETFGLVEQRLGASRVKARCLDGHNRICRIPGRLKKHLWVREGNFVIIKPWEFGGDAKGDIIYKYNPTQVIFLKKKGYLKKIEDLDEF